MKELDLAKAVEQRRTFAIISHPDAGKTTLTEKLLLYGGAIQEAGAVKAHRAQKRVTSDWMELEKQRGISITSTVLQFDYRNIRLNLLDTPGHQDFSEDTYRTLAAADNAVMLEDASKGLETQTRKLFEVCQMRSLPIFTFINKMDRPTRDPLELMDEIETELGLKPYPVNWPIGSGDRFTGVFDRRTQEFHFFERVSKGRMRVKDTIIKLGDPQIEELIDKDLYYQFKEELELLDGLMPSLDLKQVHSGQQTPVFFGSAMTNFGVELFLNSFLEYALPPMAHESTLGLIPPEHPEFTGFVFKLQANMDPRHRDRIAFVRICSGKFEKDMVVYHARLNRSVRLSYPQKLFAQDRISIDEAYPGDVIGLNNPGIFTIGDTIYTGSKLRYAGIPSFSPELFAYLKNPNPSKFKQFQKGVSELREEGAVQIMYSVDDSKRDPIVAAVGQLQFEVVQYRLEHEYNVETRLEMLPYTLARWVENGWEVLENIPSLFNTILVKDVQERPVLLFKNEWTLQQFVGSNPKIKLSKIAPVLELGPESNHVQISSQISSR
ncbi:peptide chain release factor 3 [Thermostichus vulcanus]|uniref:Peptide chain release factor 3 n=1 Tax=Thermostichus vulcanus str. 'Rupite' TaxID=2813851 RepID=A0ABT0CE85_THEVL|nr:peptide chain release factor 3 [Thermostichus vulcanus]MCJ2544032.1 peptide chain release factor 3 [Thermostichus vulcanus str. 'Rupite']